MEWNQLEYFKKVAEIRNFTQAAKKLSISQPALSRSIAKLEEELGFPLFDRCGKSTLLTQYGQLFLTHVERALHEITTGRQIVQNLLDPDCGSVSLAFLHSLGSNLVPSLLGSFRKQHPHIQFKLYQNNTPFLLEQLRTGEIDLCLCATVPTKESMGWAALFDEELFVAVPANHRLAAHSQIHLEDIAAEPIVTFKKDYGLRVLGDQLFKDAGIHPPITFEGEEIMTIAGLVEAHLGVALIPHITVLDHLNIVFLPISTPKCARTIGIVWNKTRYLSPAAQKFKNFIMESFQK